MENLICQGLIIALFKADTEEELQVPKYEVQRVAEGLPEEMSLGSKRVLGQERW